MLSSKEILQRFIDFYQARGHVLIPNVSLVPEGDSTLLFVNSGMFPLVPYLFGEAHPAGTRLMNVQRALRFEDLDDIGDNRHTTAFHMIGNWSLGDYFKKEQLPWVYELLIEELGLDPHRLYASVFEGDENAPRDEESIALLKEIFAKYGVDAQEGVRIFAYDKNENWWKRGDAVGEPGGPDSEIYYYIGLQGTGEGLNPADHQDDFIEIGNSVFMQYKKTETGWEELSQKNVDFGGGLERLAMLVQQKQDIFETDNFWPVIEQIQKITGKRYLENEADTIAMRKLADHIRAAVFLAMDGITPSNKDQGYVLRRYLRLIARMGHQLKVQIGLSAQLVPAVFEIEIFKMLYPDLSNRQDEIIAVFNEEEEKFRRTLQSAQKEVEKALNDVSMMPLEQCATKAFDLYQSLGYPVEMFLEDLKESTSDVDTKEFWNKYNALFQEHQSGSRKGAEQKFKGGLADSSEQVVKYHTATHLINAALRAVLGDHVTQRGSNITGHRLRFDFTHEERLQDDEIQKVQDQVNKIIGDALPVNMMMLSKEEAEKTGAVHAFGEKYGDQVKVYFIGDTIETAISKEFCGGPHVTNTQEIGSIEIYKQESVGKGIRRIYARTK